MNLAKEEHIMRRQMNIEIGSARKIAAHFERTVQECALPSVDEAAPGHAKWPAT
jgi:hypothetical protein